MPESDIWRDAGWLCGASDDSAGDYARRLARRIAMPSEILERMTEVERALSVVTRDPRFAGLLSGLLQGMCVWNTAKSSRLRLHEVLHEALRAAPDETSDGFRGGLRQGRAEEQPAPSETEGIGMLTCMLAAAELVERRYKRAGIGMDVFDATMGCFTRFVEEYHAMTGRYGFDRDWWTVRQLSMRLFRLDELEYELVDGPFPASKLIGVPRAISVHIPSEARIDRRHVTASLSRARVFLERYYPQWSSCPYICTSWLLSPALDNVLSEQSHIRSFRNLFTVVDVDEEATDWRLWVFRGSREPVERLPATTSLQRGIKRLLRAGKNVGVATGVLT